MTLPLIAAGAYFFFLDKKETKNQVSRNASLRTGPFTHKSGKTTGWNLFAGRPCPFYTLYAKISYAPCRRFGPPVFSAFCRSLSADMKNLIGNHKHCEKPKTKAGKGTTEKRAGESGLRGEAFLLTWSLVTFHQGKVTRPPRPWAGRCLSSKTKLLTKP